MFKPSPYGWISQYFLGFFFAYGVYLPFWSLWFKEQGVSSTDIGLLVGIGLATRCVANMVITPRIHKAEHIMPALRWLSFAALIFVGFHFFTGGSFWLMALATVLFNLCCGPVVPLSDALANYYARLKMLDYGRTRLWGSIAFIAGSTVVGYLISLYGTDMILYTALAGVFVSLLLSMRSANVMPVTRSEHHSERPKLTQLLTDGPVVKFLLLAALIQGSHAAYYSFSAIYWQQAGHSEEIIGYLWSLGVVSEVAVFALSKRLFAGWSLRALFVAASIGVMLRWGITASTTLLLGLVLVQLLHGVTFAMAHIAAIQYIQNSEEHKMVALQALYNALPLGAFIAAMTAFSGWGFEHWGANVFWVMAAMGLVALFIKVAPVTSQVQDISVAKAEPNAQN
ncbi:3-phenylpropionate MFS transporter [Vibrio vulnificus]|jgi:PPP family 3-phenylpropionic acid transporter|uniref:3-phenylpropionate MFS transporter n=1 Tax=Vibrio vulnificus TaxID=672 RepID=UPI00054400D0|nr:3-phenylpropionate MFS transporter [Vibrio vulnificus]EGQ7695204.1 3-phenylpropionate MFS transporter [Vibrio vulnificus]EGQ7834011.1 3-phenylpropionate MFS transporter [Vibrio vulnificus]EGQ7931608.1 3-phenylpropionate MFS transporter [Vibrio vulnificus]EGQ9278865.1 3-phenylpropionate MFS transporter [Vibrio vulnificus]EGQ9971054.1 3-phenylpropionate MFS transporter [Vibrio vulnificus]